MINKPLKSSLTRKWCPNTKCSSAYQCLGSPAPPHISVHEVDVESQESNQVNYSAAPIISIIANIVVVFVMSLITGVGV